jgi:NAD(P)-dependent dehydrogenase (short-subunit alcohol dehydrogenase family)
MNTAVIAGIDSGLGVIIADHLKNKGWEIIGTSRRVLSNAVNQRSRFTLLACDFSSSSSIDSCAKEITKRSDNWEILVISVGVLDPIGMFQDVNFSEWENSFYVNFIGQMRFLQQLLKSTNSISNRLIITFAGGGTNSATQNFSAYTLAKISLIKSMELLAAEYPCIKFVSLGTGWMDTPIHRQTLTAGEKAGRAYIDTVERVESGNFGRNQDLLDFIDWCWRTEREIISGRNFSLQGDAWLDSELGSRLLKDNNLFKLRRFTGAMPTEVTK